MKLEHEVFFCDCGDLEHQVIITKDDDYTYVNVGLRRNYGVLKRIFVAIRYVLGLKNNPYHFEVMLNKEDHAKLIEALTNDKRH